MLSSWGFDSSSKYQDLEVSFLRADRTGGHGDPSMTNVKILWLCIEKLISKTHFHSNEVESSDMSEWSFGFARKQTQVNLPRI